MNVCDWFDLLSFGSMSHELMSHVSIFLHSRRKLIMAHHQRYNENSDDEGEITNRTEMQQKLSSDGLEFVPTILKIKQIILLRHNDFLRLLSDFNKILEAFTQDEQYYLRFTIVPHSDSTIFWKALIRLTCSKVNQIGFQRFFFNDYCL